ncbi:peptidase S8 [Streptomyces sp. NPDC097981]|uniref:S53 family peptidase n=1 Tax=Streptomyces sp. NPDC097981 TaxID=3155428 RepID=UPI00331C9A2D
MRRRLISSLMAASVAFAGLAAGSAAAQPQAGPVGDRPPAVTGQGTGTGTGTGGPTSVRLCPDRSEPGRAFCMAVIRTDLPARPFLLPGQQPEGLSPRDIHSAYELPWFGGARRRVAIVVANDYPTAEQDLAVYRRQFHLPPCTTANGCFQKVYSTGIKPPTVDPVWTLEAAIDIQAVSASCPGCSISLVEAPTAFIVSSLLPAVDVASNLPGVVAVNGSWAIAEQPPESSVDFHFPPGLVYTFASGDIGGVPVYPSVSPNVTSVGGTRLTRAFNHRGWTESAWAGTGGGCSLYEPLPAFQQGFAPCATRSTPDISAVADPDTGFAVYDSTPGNPTVGWQVAGGTSLSAPLVAGMYALAGRPGPTDRPNTYPYAHPGSFHDIVTGCAGAYCAIPGYDRATGLGSPHGLRGLRGLRR